MYSNVKSKLVLNKAPKNPIAFNDPWKKAVIFIPVKIAGGFLVNTDSGQLSLNDIDVSDTSWKELIATGDGDLQLLWDEAITQETKKETLRYVKLDGTVEKEDEVTTYSNINYHSGKWYFGFSSSSNFSFSISQNPSYNDFNTIIQEGTFELIIDGKDIGPNEFSKFRFYVFPEVDEKKVFYISNVIKNWDINDNTKILSYEITFNRVSNKVQKSGKAVEEYFHYSSPGGCCPWPSIDRENKKISLNRKKMSMEGIVYMNEEYYNASIHNNTALVGWEIVESEEDLWVGKMNQPTLNEDGSYTQKFYSPSVIHHKNFSAGESSILNRRALPESDISFLNFLNFSENKYTDWKKYWEGVFSGDFDTKYQGECSYIDRKDMSSFEQLNEVLSTEDGPIYKQYGIANPFVKKDFGFCKLKERTWADINMYNYWCNRDIITLPFSFNYHILNQPKQWGIVGGIIDLFFMGFPFGWDSENRRITYLDGVELKFNKDICGLTSQSLIAIAQKNWGKEEQKSFFLNDFYAKDSADRFNVANRTLCIASQLENSVSFNSDNFNYGQLKVKDCDTSWLGQQHINNGYDSVNKVRNMYLANRDSSVFQLDSTFRVEINKKPKKFVICGISNKNFAAESMRFTFKDENRNNKWVGAFLTTSNFRNTSRDWANDFYCNYFNILDFQGEQLQYPVYPSVNNNFNNTISIPYQKEYLSYESYAGSGFTDQYSFYCRGYKKPLIIDSFGHYEEINEIDKWNWIKASPDNDWFLRSNVGDYIYNWTYNISVTNFPVGTTDFLQTFVNRVKNKIINLKIGFELSLEDRKGIYSTNNEGELIFKLSNTTSTKVDGSLDIHFGKPIKRIKSFLEKDNYNFPLRNTENSTVLNIGSNDKDNLNAINIKLISFNPSNLSAIFNINLCFNPDMYLNTDPLLTSGDIPKNSTDATWYKKGGWSPYSIYMLPLSIHAIGTKTKLVLKELMLTNEEG